MQTDLRWLFDGVSLFSVLSCIDGHAIVKHNLFALLDVLLVDKMFSKCHLTSRTPEAGQTGKVQQQGYAAKS